MPFNPVDRLKEEIAFWKHSHPPNFVAKAIMSVNGAPDLMQWEVGIPGPSDSDWEGGLYRLLVQFPEKYPFSPPKCRFSPPIFHPNVFPNGEVLHPFLQGDVKWNSEMTILFICKAIQDMLEEPLLDYVANPEASYLHQKRENDYIEKVVNLAKEFSTELMFQRYWS
ncbi:hypothetical protein M514_05269 [Trichuris suis]|uniref:UBC core domain-containing protein n=1 Tax=Trichuris suis TaxID=68888 RepID=A0A085NQ12_9BILA|nr:hypothetical protein M513_05269 [Trichuris suis]KFD71558.1 hypothetical protein M514_05269 [Trichuris suis]